jgi:hypothetical protein
MDKLTKLSGLASGFRFGDSGSNPGGCTNYWPPRSGGMQNFIGNRIGFDFFLIGSSTLRIGPEKINKNSIGGVSYLFEKSLKKAGPRILVIDLMIPRGVQEWKVGSAHLIGGSCCWGEGYALMIAGSFCLLCRTCANVCRTLWWGVQELAARCAGPVLRCAGAFSQICRSLQCGVQDSIIYY